MMSRSEKCHGTDDWRVGTHDDDYELVRKYKVIDDGHVGTHDHDYEPVRKKAFSDNGDVGTHDHHDEQVRKGHGVDDCHVGTHDNDYDLVRKDHGTDDGQHIRKYSLFFLSPPAKRTAKLHQQCHLHIVLHIVLFCILLSNCGFGNGLAGINFRTNKEKVFPFFEFGVWHHSILVTQTTNNRVSSSSAWSRFITIRCVSGRAASWMPLLPAAANLRFD